MAILRNIPTAVDDNDLISRYRSTGDLNVLALLYQRYMDLAYAVAFKYLRDTDAAKDAIMDVFEELIDKLKKHEVINFRSWLHTVVKNHCLMKIRSDSKYKIIDIGENGMQSDEKLHQEDVNEKEWQLDQMEDCIAKLDNEQKQAVQLFYLQQKSYNEISEVTGLEWNKVRSLIQNGKRNLKICMDKKIMTATTK